jgi:hypothetical protein
VLIREGNTMVQMFQCASDPEVEEWRDVEGGDAESAAEAFARWRDDRDGETEDESTVWVREDAESKPLAYTVEVEHEPVYTAYRAEDQDDKDEHE